MSQKLVRSSLAALLTTASASAMILASPVYAQDETADDEDTIVVTGTRIERPALEAPSPITSIGAENIQRSGELSIVDILNEVPALVGSTDNDDAIAGGIGSTGLTLLNLRNLGTNRTLTLVNGRRHVGGSGATTSVDTNTIPIDLIERVDVLTGGASSIYGADAVTGAVNFILKDDFEGLSVRAQGGLTPDHGDAATYLASVTAGKNFMDDRGNVVVSFEYSKEEGLNNSDRDFASDGLFSLLDNPDFALEGSADRRRQVFFQDATIRFASPEGGVAIDFFDGFDLLFDFEGDGDPYDQGEVITFRNSIGGSSTRISDFQESLTGDIERFVGNVNTRYEFNPNVTGFLELKFAQVSSFNSGNPAFSDLIPINVAENPFVPDVIADAANSAGADFVFISHDTFELGRRTEDIRRRTYRVAAGVETTPFPDTFKNLNLDLSFVYGRTDERFIAENNLVLDRFYAAMDAVIDPGTGQPTCRSNLDPDALPPQIPFPGGFGFLGFFDAFNTTVTPDNYGTTSFFTPGPNSGCQPLNLFGLGNASQAAIDFVNDDSLREATIEQTVITGVFSGDTGGVFELPAGPVGFAIGGEYRDEQSEDIPPIINTEGLTFGNRLFPTVGGYDVIEGFAEIRVPVLKDLPLANLLSVDAAVRVSDYSTIGSTLAWQTGAIWAPIEDIRFRGTYAVAVRAPNIAELFNPQNQSFFLPDDPCDIDNIPQAADPGLRAMNCATILTPLGVDPMTFQGDDILNATFEGVQGGNPDLSEETAKTFTVGFVLQPRWFENLTLTADYFNIEITDGIIPPASQDIVDQCVDLPSINNPFCDLISRRSDGGLNGLEVIPVNVAFFETSGIDYEVNYFFDPADIGMSNLGQFNLRYVGSYLERLDVVSLPGQTPDEERDETATLLGDDAPVHIGALDLTWFYNKFSANYRWRYRSAAFRDEIDEIDAAASGVDNPPFVPFTEIETSAVSTHDIQLRYEVRDNAEIYVGVNNMFDQEPDIGSVQTPVSAVGRFVYAGFAFEL
ncbi:TonB-dependent receptor [Hyphococcus flavus]|uniref:TonB-dependent receptor n=1 Tax=Hyphococcus flavus TaxID=1866326 RepID=A0AAF0CDW7_9PROT|nr:TonB-dependent receptor [Hyphococcus flavus]WDI30371.1 TonB-dependent receptor [Hyphococcus flavus]